MLKSSKNGIFSNFQRLSNSTDFSKMSTKENSKFLENLKKSEITSCINFENQSINLECINSVHSILTLV